MTLAIRVIPCLDVDNGRVVKGVNFSHLKDAGDPVELAASYDLAGADELTFLDITASSGNRGTVLDVVRRTAETLFIPLTVGGGIRSVDDVDALLRAGADKISVNTAAISRPSLISEISQRFGNQVLVLSVQLGVGEILLNSMDADGTKSGFDIEMISKVRKRISVPLIASGGAGKAEHFVAAARAGADALLAASIFHFGEVSIGEVKDSLRSAGITTR